MKPLIFWRQRGCRVKQLSLGHDAWHTGAQGLAFEAPSHHRVLGVGKAALAYGIASRLGASVIAIPLFRHHGAAASKLALPAQSRFMLSGRTGKNAVGAYSWAMFLLTVLTWFIAALAVTGPAPAFAAIPSGTGPYTVDVTYDDSLYIDYYLNRVWHRSIVSVGGITDTSNGTLISDQLYCLDPGVPYYSNANTAIISSGPPKIESVYMEGYTVISPSEISSAAKDWDWNALTWLLGHGYQGNYYDDIAPGAPTNPSVTNLQNLLNSSGLGPPGAVVTPQVALVATKVAIWQIVSGTSFELLDTTPLYPTISALAAAMVAAAQNAAPPAPIVPASFTLALDKSSATLTTSGGYQYYGPITVNAELDNPSVPLPKGPINLDKIFLNLTGTNTTGIQLVSSIGGALLPSGTDALYNITTSTPYIDGATVNFADNGSGVWKNSNPDPSTTFYLKIPLSRTLGSSAVTIDAVAGIADVPLPNPPTPLVFIYQNSALQPDWNAIQPFVGLAATDERAFLFANGVLRNADPPVTTPVPALDAKSLLILAMSVLLLGGARYGRRRREQRTRADRT